MKKLLLLMAVALGLNAAAQQVKVVSIQQVKVNQPVYHPEFMPDGNLLVTSESYDGLGIVNVKTRSYTSLTTMQGAGYYPAVSEDGKTIVTRSMNNKDFTQNLYKIDVATKQVSPIVQKIEHVNQIKLEKGELTYAVGGKAIKARLKNISIPASRITTYVTEENLKIVVYRGNIRTILDPLAGQFGDWDAQYCWTSLSPDGKKILFTCRNNSYTCDLNGKNVVKLGNIRAPKWCGNGYIVGMNDKSDGHTFTKSDILIVKSNGTGLQQLTTSSSDIKMFPSASADGNKIAYHTLDGKIFVMTISK